MLSRFNGPNNRDILVATILEQRLVAGDRALAERIADIGELRQVEPGTAIIEQDGEDQDVFLLLTGSFQAVVNGRVVANRAAGNHVGEMAAIQPTQRRSASMIASERSVILKLTEPQFCELIEAFPNIMRSLAKELARRLEQRNTLVTTARDRIRIFIISSAEAIEIARAIQNALSHDFLVTVWPDGVFQASHYPIESLENILDDSDFAIAIVQPDDITESRGTSHRTARDNVIFELGMFIGRIGRRRSFLVEPRGEELRLPSDLSGITTLPYRYTSIADLPSSLGPVCNCIRDIIRDLGPNN
jgi:CRP/FNR family cyclic AMP-dependent transcriptional regulator